MRKTAIPHRQRPEGRETPITVIGVDPDTKCTGFALVVDGKATAVGVFDIRHLKVKGREAAIQMGADLSLFFQDISFTPTLSVIEGQQIYRKSKADGNDLLLVALVSGAAAGSAALNSQATVIPRPKDWKGQQPKGVNQSRTLDRLGWSYSFDGPKRPVRDVVIPEDVNVVGEIPPAHMKEVLDALGLALWGYDQCV